MRKNLMNLNVLLLVLFTMTGCAVTYHPVNPPSLHYDSFQLQEGIGLSYKHDVLKERGNDRYYKKQKEYQLSIVAIKLINYSESEINTSRDIAFFSGDHEIVPIEPKIAKIYLRQHSYYYIPYLFLSFFGVNIHHSSGGGSSYPAGVIAGSSLAFGNIVHVWRSNSIMVDEFYQYDLRDRNIRPGEMVFGILVFPEAEYQPITVRFR